jgi:hypothetical protein
MLLTSFKNENPDKIEFQALSPTSLNDLPAVAALRGQYDWPAEDTGERDGVAKGVLVVAKNPDGKDTHEFLKRFPTIEDVQRGGDPHSPDGAESQRVFKGEAAIITAIRNLSGEKGNVTVYFTQGNGELRLDDNAMMLPPNNRGLIALRDRLEKVNYTVKPLNLVEAGGTPKVPDDAFAVVIAGPQQNAKLAFESQHIEALREYMKRPKARMIVLLDVQRDREWELSETGLEKFLSEFGVQVEKDVIFNAYSQSINLPHAVVAAGADRMLREVFLSQQERFTLFEARSVRPMTGAPDQRYVVTPFLETWKPADKPLGQWAELNPSRFLDSVEANPRDVLLGKLKEHEKSNAPAIPLAVTVREQADPKAAADPHAFMRPESQGDPRMVVFGDATLASNFGMSRGPDIYGDLVVNALAWLRGRSDLMEGVQAKTRSDYRLNLKPAEGRNLKFYPGLVLLLGIAGCGIGVLLTRRR